jgi:integrase
MSKNSCKCWFCDIFGSTLARNNYMTTITEKTSDYLNTDELKRINRYFQKEQNYQMALLIEFGFRTLLRYSDISRFTWVEVLNKDELLLNEKKTGKKRSIKVGAVLKALLIQYYEIMHQPDLDDKIFKYTLRHTNRLLQFGARLVGIRKKRISTHSLRKSGARFLYEENNKSEDVFLKISMILNHSSTQVSRRYLGITKEEISDVYAGFDISL